MNAEKKMCNTGSKYGHAKNRPSYMQPTESSSNKAREKIHNTCMSTRMKASCGNRMESFGDAQSDYVKKEAPSTRRKKAASSSCLEDVPRYMLPTESSAKKSLGAKYKHNRPPRIPSGSYRNNLATPKDEPQRVQMSNMAMGPFIESLRRGSYSDRSDLDRAVLERRHSSSSLARSHSKESSETDTSECGGGGGGWFRESKNLPRYQQPTVLASLRAHGRTRA